VWIDREAGGIKGGGGGRMGGREKKVEARGEKGG